jgi:nitrogen fixation protein FixH
MTPQHTPNGRPATARPVTGRTVLFGMLAFFGVIFAVNGAFVYFALDSWPGLSSDKAYEDGLAYNKTLAAAERQRALGWQSAIELDAGQVLSVQFMDKSGSPVTGLTPNARFVRPTHEGEDREVQLNEVDQGKYTASVAGLASGRWKVELRVPGGNGTRFFIVHELLVK